MASEGSTSLEALLAHLDQSLDEEDDEEDWYEEDHLLVVEEAVGWKWPVPPKREVKEEVDAKTGKTVQRSEIAEDGVQVSFF